MLFRSVSLTPYRSETSIDDARLKQIIADAYAAAGVKREDIDTGAVILTGEALRRELDLEALLIAPTFTRAQDLLLKIQEGGR